MSRARVVVHRRPEGVIADADTLGIAVDVLRATSTLSVARANGAAAIVPFAEPAGARAFRDRTPGALACGEREGRIVPGFDLGNSPFEYPAETVAGRTLAFASTNGSQAMLALSGAGDRRFGAFVNAGAVWAHARTHGAGRITIVCAGKEGGPAPEDEAFAAWLAARFAAAGARIELAGGGDPAAFLAGAPADATTVHRAVAEAPHGRWLAGLGEAFAADVEWCAGLDRIGRCDGW